MNNFPAPYHIVLKSYLNNKSKSNMKSNSDVPVGTDIEPFYNTISPHTSLPLETTPKLTKVH